MSAPVLASEEFRRGKAAGARSEYERLCYPVGQLPDIGAMLKQRDTELRAATAELAELREFKAGAEIVIRERGEKLEELYEAIRRLQREAS